MNESRPPLYLMRAGPAAALRRPTIQIGLNQEGRDDAHAAGREIGRVVLERGYRDISVLCSPAHHAAETGNAVMDGIQQAGGLAIKLTFVPELDESGWRDQLVSDTRARAKASRQIFHRYTGATGVPTLAIYSYTDLINATVSLYSKTPPVVMGELVELMDDRRGAVSRFKPARPVSAVSPMSQPLELGPPKILGVRHGHDLIGGDVANGGARLMNGVADRGLTLRGFTQALSVGVLISEYALKHGLWVTGSATSPLGRAKETWMAINAMLPAWSMDWGDAENGYLPIFQTLRERDAGRDTWKSRIEREALAAELGLQALKGLEGRGYYTGVPFQEEFEALRERSGEGVEKLWDMQLRLGGGVLVFVSHAGFLQGAISHWRGASLAETIRDNDIHNGEVICFDEDEHGQRRAERIIVPTDGFMKYFWRNRMPEIEKMYEALRRRS